VTASHVTGSDVSHVTGSCVTGALSGSMLCAKCKKKCKNDFFFEKMKKKKKKKKAKIKPAIFDQKAPLGRILRNFSHFFCSYNMFNK
jgi:hypothetical protein